MNRQEAWSDIKAGDRIVLANDQALIKQVEARIIRAGFRNWSGKLSVDGKSWSIEVIG